MANPTRRWDRVPFWAVYRNPITGGPLDVTVEITAGGTFTRADGREIYLEGAAVKVRAGVLEEQDPDVRAAVRDAWRTEDQALLGAQFDGQAWDVEWDTQIVPCAVFGRFPAVDDPDLVQVDFSARVVEKLKNAQVALGVPRGVPGAKGDPGPPPVVVTVDTVDDIIGMPAGTWALVLE